VSFLLKENRYVVYRAHAEFIKTLGQLDRAAILFAKSELPFEDVILKLLGLSDNVESLEFSLRYIMIAFTQELHSVQLYLEEILKSLELTSKSQRTMVSFIHLFYLHLFN